MNGGVKDALGLIDGVLAGRPAKDDLALTAATVLLTGVRDGLVQEGRQGGLDPGRRKRLDHVNAIITVVLGIRFPIGEAPWTELEKARAWLCEVDA